MAPLPFDKTKLSPADLALYESMVAKRKAQGAPFDGPYAALSNHPQLCAKIEALGYFLKFEGHLPRDVYQFVVLSVARATGAAFEWVDHAAHAEAAGVPQEVIETLREKGVSVAAFPAPYDLIAQLLSHTLVWRDVPQAVQDACIGKYGLSGYVEIVVLSGFYQMFAGINQGFAVPLPAGVADPFE